MSHGRARACDAICLLLFMCMCVSPAEILQGGVKIMKNRDLSYAPKVNWLDILKDGSVNISIFDNGPESE